MTQNEKKAIEHANAELVRRFGTSTFRNGGARSYLWWDLHNAELDRLNKASVTTCEAELAAGAAPR
jgi:hypothetical protein